MMTPCRKLFYAVESVVFIAYHSHEAPVSSRDIAQMQGLPARHLEHYMQRLVRGKILRGMRGPRGGYVLARNPEDITVEEICRLVNDEDVICSTPNTTAIGNGVVRPFWRLLHQEITEKLENITIADLCRDADTHNIPRTHPIKLASPYNHAILLAITPLLNL